MNNNYFFSDNILIDMRENIFMANKCHDYFPDSSWMTFNTRQAM